MDRHMRFEGAALITLSLMLVTVFVLSVWMYDDLAGETEDGTLAVFAANVQEFIDENEAVSAFLGLDEGTVETAFSEAGIAIHGASCFFLNGLNSALFNQGETIRLTVNGVSKIFTAEIFTTGAYVGNAWLMTDSDLVSTDNGYDFAVSATAIVTLFSGSFYSREAGTYNIKIERMVS